MRINNVLSFLYQKLDSKETIAFKVIAMHFGRWGPREIINLMSRDTAAQ